MTDAWTDLDNARIPSRDLADPSQAPDASSASGQTGAYVPNQADPPVSDEDDVEPEPDPAISPDDPPAEDDATAQPEADAPAGPPSPAVPAPLRPVELAEAFAARFASAAKPLSHAAVRVRFAGLSQLSWAEFMGSLGDRSFCYAIGLDAELTGSLPAPAWLEVSPSAAFALIESLLGGTGGQAYVPTRGLTGLERSLLGRVVRASALATAASSLSDARDDWSQSDGFAAVLAASYDLAVGAQVGRMRLCVPIDPTQAQALTRPLGRPCQPLEISVTTEYSEIASSDLAELAPGDILTSQTPVDGEVIVRAAGIPKFAGRLGACEGQRAVTIRKKVGGDEPPPA